MKYNINMDKIRMTVRFKNGGWYGFSVSRSIHDWLKRESGEGNLNMFVKHIISWFLYEKQTYLPYLINGNGVEADMIIDMKNRKMSAAKYLEMVVNEYFSKGG